MDKSILYKLCADHIKARMETSLQAIATAQESANEETKSSAGDKYETGRAMAQLEIENNSSQLAESRKMQAALEQIDLTPSGVIQPGSLVTTDKGVFFIAVSIGKLTIGSQDVFIISAVSPMGKQLTGRKQGDTYRFNKVEHRILNII